MPNLYITNSTTTTTVGLTTERKTTPSLVATCGNTTYYGGLTTCAAWATSPNKIVVTSGSTTYYTMAPAKGTKFVNFVVPTQCSQVAGTILTKCCAGYLANYDKAAETITPVDQDGHSYYGCNKTTPPTGNCFKLLSYVTSDTTKNCYDFVYPTLDHTHDTSIVFDDNTGICNVRFCSRHKGVKIYCNYNTAPDYIYAFYNCTTGIANSGWDYLYVNGSDQCQSTTHICATFYKTTTANGTWNTSGVTNGNGGSGTTSYTRFSSFAVGPCNAALLRIQGNSGAYMTHYQYIGENTLSAVAKGCDIGFGLPIFEVNMACYDHDIDKLPTGTILMTNCPVSCFDTNCWETASYLSNRCCLNVFTNRARCREFVAPIYRFCVSSPIYTGGYVSYSSFGTFANYGMWPWSCSGSVGNCSYTPIISTWHPQYSHNNSGVSRNYYIRSICLPMVKGGSCYIVHK